MNRKQLQSLIAASLFSSALLSGAAFADDKPMDPNMPMGNSAPAKPADTAKPMDPSMPMDAKTDAKPMKHHKKHKKPMDKDMAKPADGMAKPADGMAKPADGQKM
jgi:hypothetical protein